MKENCSDFYRKINLPMFSDIAFITYATLAFCIEIWKKIDELCYLNTLKIRMKCSDLYRKINLSMLNDITFITYPTLAFCIEIWLKIK